MLPLRTTNICLNLAADLSSYGGEKKFRRSFRPSPWFVPRKGSRRAREAHKPFLPRMPPAVQNAERGASPASARSSPRGGSAPSAWLSAPACWVKVATKADMAAWDRNADQRATSTATRLDRRRTGTSPALARAGARTKEAASSLRRPPTLTANTTKRQMSALCGGVQRQGRRPEHDHPGGRAAPSRTREIQAVGNDLKPPVVDTIACG